ncbi:MAG TPA: hypothetical protein VFL91_33075 [Thermomicrobiales bacterium]|nr:hypothetical protein [Thermomicrobiales bacterium]
MAAEGPGGLVRVLAKPVGARARDAATPTYVNLGHLIDAAVAADQDGAVVVTLRLPGRTLRVEGAAAAALDAHLRARATALPAEERGPQGFW